MLFSGKENVFMCLAVTKFVLRKINFGVWFIQTFLQKMHQIRQKKQNAAKENESNPTEEKMRSCGEGDIERRWGRCDRPTSGARSTSALVNRDRRSRRSIDYRTARGRAARSGLSLLSLSLSFSGNDLKWKWGWKIISGSKVKILVNQKSFSGKYHFPWQPNMRVWGKMIYWIIFTRKSFSPKTNAPLATLILWMCCFLIAQHLVT